ncbi:UNVERIFIED_CONTAM: hypothetical protein FKN15_073704 [Acipenser sinensis]
MAAQLHGTMIKMENFQKLLELKKDLIGIDNLVIPGRLDRFTKFFKIHKRFTVTPPHLNKGTRERMSAGYRPLEDKDQPSKSPPPSSLGTWPVGVAAER